MANCIRCGRQLPGLSFGKKICQWCVRHEAHQRGELADDAPQPIMATPWVRRESSVGLTQVIFGRSAVEGWRKLLYMNAINRFLRDAPAVDVHIVTQEPD